MEECACTLLGCWQFVGAALFVGALIGFFIAAFVIGAYRGDEDG